jgi:hypothetical protein
MGLSRPDRFLSSGLANQTTRIQCIYEQTPITKRSAVAYAVLFSPSLEISFTLEKPFIFPVRGLV